MPGWTRRGWSSASRRSPECDSSWRTLPGRGGRRRVRALAGRPPLGTQRGTRAPHGPLLDLARAAGVPTARQELSAHIDGVRVIVQQRLPGSPPARADAALVTAMLALNARLAGLFAGRSAVSPVELYLTEDGPGFCLHRPLAGHSRGTARLLERIHEVGTTAPPVTGDDLVHLDFHPGLVVGEKITGLVDWDGARRGDRHSRPGHPAVQPGLVCAAPDRAARRPARRAGRGAAPGVLGAHEPAAGRLVDPPPRHRGRRPGGRTSSESGPW